MILVSEFDGFCAGVASSISLLEREIEEASPIYLSSELVHNNLVTSYFNEKGVHYLEELLDENDEISTKGKEMVRESTLVIAAHGLPRVKFEKYAPYFKKVVYATCPVVKSRQESIEKQSENTILFVKNTTHSEVQTLENGGKLHFAQVVKLNDSTEVLAHLSKNIVYSIHTQTTFPETELKRYLEYLDKEGIRYVLKSSICPNCKQRQESAKRLAKKADVVIVVGSPHSSNANELVNIAKSEGVKAYLVESEAEVKGLQLNKNSRIALISSASSSKETLLKIRTALEE